MLAVSPAESVVGVGPVEAAGKERFLVPVPHPSNFGGTRPLSGHLYPEQLAEVNRPWPDRASRVQPARPLPHLG